MLHCPTVRDRSGSSDSDALKVQCTAQFGREHAQGCVWTDLYWGLKSGHTERGLPQRTAVSVRCEMLHSKQTLLTIIF